jgi:hypothetical protein
MTRGMQRIAFAGVLVAAALGNAAMAAEKLVVHEWGTFTSLADETGKQLGGINVDDEPLPSFVHDLNPYVLGNQHWPRAVLRMKAAPERHPYVTLRLETPVVYFYPPKTANAPMSVDFDVQFRGGWLTQFFPQAKPDAPGLEQGKFNFGPITRDTIGRLTWTNLQLADGGAIPETKEAVWLTPRNVHASYVTAKAGETEKYLFYRGVGNIDAPLSVANDPKTNVLTLRAAFQDVLKLGETLTIRSPWLVHIRADGATAYRALDRVEVTANHAKAVVGKAKSDFAEGDYSRDNLQRLLGEMHAALVKEGLFDEEATAMLTTWQKSYFASGGLRLFYVVPRAWTDHYLPITISKPAEITRVMVARTELISPEQRVLLDKLTSAPISDAHWIDSLMRPPYSPAVQRFLGGHSDFGDLGVAIPADYQMYLDLGRFRNALVLYEQGRRPSDSLAKFIANYSLGLFSVSEDTKKSAPAANASAAR